MKINKQLLTQIIKEELQNVLERKTTQAELDAMGTVAGAPDPGDVKNLSPEQRAQLDQMGTVAGAPDPGESAKPTPEQQAQLDQMGTLAPQQDVEQMATKYAKVKQVLAKLVREL
tara:strand:- start:576 stop:920 length:345 start_codon:yes stop_codon:yes gene_type:complete